MDKVGQNSLYNGWDWVKFLPEPMGLGGVVLGINGKFLQERERLVSNSLGAGGISHKSFLSSVEIFCSINERFLVLFVVQTS